MRSLVWIDELAMVETELAVGEMLEPWPPVEAAEEEEEVVVTAVPASPSSSAEAELKECALLCRSCEKCLAMAEELDDEKSF